MKLRRIIPLLLSLVLLVTLCACGNNSDGSTGNEGNSGSSSNGSSSSTGGRSDKDHLVIAAFSDPTDLNPTMQGNQYSHTIKRQMYETLVLVDPGTGEITPNLAESWFYEDDLTLVLNLRKGVKFHDGSEMKASDILFTFDLMRESEYANLATAHINYDETEALDDYTVKLVTTEPFPAQLNYFNWPLTAIVGENAYNAADGDFGTVSLGTGPYKLVSYSKDSEVVLEEHEDYWEEGKPYIPNLAFRIIPEDATRTLELESKGVDIALMLSIMDVDRLEASPDFKVIREDSYQMNYIFFNFDNPVLQNYNVKKAICMAVDWENVIPAAFGAAGRFAPSYVAQGVEGYMTFDLFPYDPEGAKALLEAEGYSPGDISLEMTTSTMETRVKMCEMMQAALDEIGINLSIRTMETASFIDSYFASEHDITTIGYFAMTGEAGKILPFFQSDNIYNSLQNWSIPEFDQLVDEAVTTIDKEKRIELFQQAQTLMFENLPAYPVLQNVLLAGVQADVEGLVLDSSFECHQFKNVYFAD